MRSGMNQAVYKGPNPTKGMQPNVV